MEHDVHTVDGRSAGVAITDIALDEAEAILERVRQLAGYLVKVPLVTRRKIVERNDPLPVAEEGFDEIGSDESGGTGNEPGRLALRKARSQVERKNGNSPKSLMVGCDAALFDGVPAVNG